jgi:hypothetical protein
MESHVVARLQLDPPPIVFLLRRSWNEPKRRTKSLNRKGLYFYSPEFDPTQLPHACVE